eukprot:gnl/TRDRNA2_/TRDRNA2_57660_c0_seq1.p1 gnl/TRDRNA2_/TRDRNA2_57660_c0~~gnl/TRDRNA2_/TRDRNA2_57660_c0_seq1.p1  ORF type:complete len:146 (-),score=33.06 gnl/TRDRNA2_/TRDRNA2_57660_c0_seq1:202-639(-)
MACTRLVLCCLALLAVPSMGSRKFRSLRTRSRHENSKQLDRGSCMEMCTEIHPEYSKQQCMKECEMDTVYEADGSKDCFQMCTEALQGDPKKCEVKCGLVSPHDIAPGMAPMGPPADEPKLPPSDELTAPPPEEEGAWGPPGEDW